MKDTKTTAAARLLGLAAAAIAVTAAVALLSLGGTAVQAASERGPAGQPAAPDASADATRAGADAAGGKLRALQAEYDAVVAEYGFKFEPPGGITDEALAEMDGRLRALGSEYEKRLALILPDAGMLPGYAPSAEQLAKLDEMVARMAAEADEIMRGYGFDIARPDLSGEEEARMNERLAGIEARMDALTGAPAREGEAPPERGGGSAAAGAGAGAVSSAIAGTGGAPAHGRDADPGRAAEFAAGIDALQAEYDAVVAEYGFVFESPDLSEEEYAEMDERLAAMMSTYDRRLAQIMPTYATWVPGYVPTSEQLAELDGLSARMAAEADEIMRGYGFVIGEPDLSEEEEARMNERLAGIEARMDALYGEHAPADARHRSATAQPNQYDGE